MTCPADRRRRDDIALPGDSSAKLPPTTRSQGLRSRAMPGLSTLQACDNGHVLHYPAALDDEAISTEDELAFCSMCECGTVYFVVVWGGDRARIMASGGMELMERFEAQHWPEATYDGEDGVFIYRAVTNQFEINLFLADHT